MINILMHGCNGKMGQVITHLAAEDDNVTIAAGVDAYDGIANDYPVFSSLNDCNIDVDVIIDFSNAQAVDGLLDYAVASKTPVVLCTTGLSEEQLDKVEAASKHVAVLRSANMSIGINVILKLLKEAVSRFAPEGFDVEIVEKHHNQKLDAPSGTAIALADAMNEEMNGMYEYVYDRSQVRKSVVRRSLEYQLSEAAI